MFRLGGRKTRARTPGSSAIGPRICPAISIAVKRRSSCDSSGMYMKAAVMSLPAPQPPVRMMVRRASPASTWRIAMSSICEI